MCVKKKRSCACVYVFFVVFLCLWLCHVCVCACGGETLTRVWCSVAQVFMRELISNASDALEKLRFVQVTGEEQIFQDAPLQISITSDEEKGLLTLQVCLCSSSSSSICILQMHPSPCCLSEGRVMSLVCDTGHRDRNE